VLVAILVNFPHQPWPHAVVLDLGDFEEKTCIGSVDLRIRMHPKKPSLVRRYASLEASARPNLKRSKQI